MQCPHGHPSLTSHRRRNDQRPSSPPQSTGVGACSTCRPPRRRRSCREAFTAPPPLPRRPLPRSPRAPPRCAPRPGRTRAQPPCRATSRRGSGSRSEPAATEPRPQRQPPEQRSRGRARRHHAAGGARPGHRAASSEPSRVAAARSDSEPGHARPVADPVQEARLIGGSRGPRTSSAVAVVALATAARCSSGGDAGKCRSASQNIMRSGAVSSPSWRAARR